MSGFFFLFCLLLLLFLVRSFYFVKHFRAHVNTLIYNNNISTVCIEWEVTLNNELLVHVDPLLDFFYVHSGARTQYIETVALTTHNGSNDKRTRMGTTATTPSPQNTATQQLSIQSIWNGCMYKYFLCHVNCYLFHTFHPMYDCYRFTSFALAAHAAHCWRFVTLHW